MTLRDYFAAKALLIVGANMRAIVEMAKKNNLLPEEQLAKEAYVIADAMLKAGGSL